MGDLPVYVLERRFNASRDLVWRAWTEPDLLSHWFGPNIETIIHKFELEPGGLWLNEMRMGDTSMYQRAEFTEVTPTTRLCWLQGSSDADWNLIKTPNMPDWPLQMLTEVAFESDGDATQMRLEWTPFEASKAEIEAFAAAMDGLGKGWGAGMDLLADLLNDLQARSV
ncbi:MAG: SRPBCC domain-containing protein [Pseudomonadota bacterium]